MVPTNTVFQISKLVKFLITNFLFISFQFHLEFCDLLNDSFFVDWNWDFDFHHSIKLSFQNAEVASSFLSNLAEVLEFCINNLLLDCDFQPHGEISLFIQIYNEIFDWIQFFSHWSILHFFWKRPVNVCSIF